MMNRTFAFLILLLIVFLGGCGVFSSTSYSSPDILLTHEFRGDSIAVFDFNTHGSSLSPATGRFAADKLAETLFLKGKIKIIDRTSIKKALTTLSMNPETFDKSQLAEFGAETGARYVSVGQLYKSSNSDFLDEKTKKRISLSFRIISVETGEVVGVAAISAEYKGGVNEVIENMISKIVDKMNELT